MNKDQLLRKTIFVFQGGGALGSYQMGAFQALDEYGYEAEMIVGISIGAINAAIITGNYPQYRLARLYEFWDTITTSIPVPLIDFYGLSKIHNWLGAQKALVHGQPGFYQPRLVNPSSLANVTPDKISYYDTAPLRSTLLKLIDFDYLNQNHIRLALGAVEVSSGDFIFFDSAEQEITVDHIMASAALPPGFPAIKIDDKYYVDGGVYSNTPLVKAINEFAETQHDKSDRLCFIVDLFSAMGNNPQNLDELLERVKDIQYSSHSRGSPFYDVSVALTKSINYLSQYITEEGKKNPQVQQILNSAHIHKVDVVQLIYKSANKNGFHNKDYNFSKEMSKIHCDAGYQQTREIIEKYQHDWQQSGRVGLTVYAKEGAIYRYDQSLVATG